MARCLVQFSQRIALFTPSNLAENQPHLLDDRQLSTLPQSLANDGYVEGFWALDRTKSEHGGTRGRLAMVYGDCHVPGVQKPRLSWSQVPGFAVAPSSPICQKSASSREALPNTLASSAKRWSVMDLAARSFRCWRAAAATL